MKYLTIGTDTIIKDKFKPVQDQDERSVKPVGGMWFTRYYEEYDQYNEWVEFLLLHPSILHAKTRGNDFMIQPCSLVTLKENSKIFKLVNKESYDKLINNYSYDNKKISYELLSHDYDGIYVDLLALSGNMPGVESMIISDQYAVTTLILFNPECIDYYQSGRVDIDYDPNSIYGYEACNYVIKCDKVKKRVL